MKAIQLSLLLVLIATPYAMADGSSYLTSARVDPICVRQGVDYFRLMIGIADPNIISITVSTLGRIKYQGKIVDPITLYDDGTHGDQVSNDQVFTIDHISIAQPSGNLIGKVVIRSRDFTFVYSDFSELVSNEDIALTLHYIDPNVPICRAITLDNDIQRTDYVVNIVQELSGPFPAHLIDYYGLLQRYYVFFIDDRDFIFSVPVFNTSTAPGAAGFVMVSNNVQGIGYGLFDFSGLWGSSGRLQGMIYLFFGTTLGKTLGHEILHRWAAYLNPSLDLARTDSHWDCIQAGRSGFGNNYGSYDNIEHVSGNTYQAWNNPTNDYYGFNDLELYLMGLVGIEDVNSPIITLQNLVLQETQWAGDIKYFIYTADGMRNVSTDEIVSVEGPRIPSYADSQKHFRSAMIVVYDRLLTDIELTYYDYAMQEYEKTTSTLHHGFTFQYSTRGLADISTILPISMDFAGFAKFASYYLEKDCGACEGAELTSDGDVDMDDLKVLSSNWLKGHP
ncbi:MAG: hypothetical protein ISS79_04630 [Phycisphaerae bacterium]|nr:hypothetical protein [Phycisphaerae bacterium]